MLEIWQYGNDTKAFQEKRAEIESKGYELEREFEDTTWGNLNADEKKSELIIAGYDVFILKTRNQILIWSKKSKKEDYAY